MSGGQKVKQRVMLLADAFNIGHKQFAEQLGMTYSNFTGRAGETPLNSNTIAKILSAYPSVDAHWLLTGEGEMFKNGRAAYLSPEKRTKKANDFRDIHETDSPASAHEVPYWLIEEHRIHGETILSQQRTIEKLVDKLKD
jgi:hypothetical protein